MPSRRVGRPIVVVASLIAFSVITLVFIGEGFKVFVRKDGGNLGGRDFTFGLHFRAATNSINNRDVASAQVDCHDHVSVLPTLMFVDGIQYEEEAVDAGSTTVSTFLAQGTNTVSLALQGRSDMVSVILANINSLVSHPTASSNSARDATGMLAIALVNAKPGVSRTAALSVTTTSLESVAAFELLKKSALQDDHVHSDDCDCASCVASPVALPPLTAAPPFPTLHPLMPREYMATVTVTVTSCPGSSATGPSSNSTASGGENPGSEPESPLNSKSPGGNNPTSSPDSSNSTASGVENPIPATESASNPTKPGSLNSSPSNVAPFANHTASAQGAAGGPAGSALSSSAIANAASVLMGNASQPTGNAQSSNNAANPPSSATSTKSSPAENTAPASAPTINPPISSQASAASSGLDNNILSLISHVKLTLANIGYLIVTVGPVACLVIMGQVWLL